VLSEGIDENNGEGVVSFSDHLLFEENKVVDSIKY
jgi:hypothetical protein